MDAAGLGVDRVYGVTDVARAVHKSVSRIRQVMALGLATPTVPVGDRGDRRLFSRADLEAMAERLGWPLALNDEGAK